MKLSLKLSKTKHTPSYMGINLSRILLSIFSLGIVKYYSLQSLELFVGILLGVNISYLLIEVLFDLTNRFPLSSYFVSAFDLTSIYVFVYISGMNSFFLAGLIYTTALSSQNIKIKQGLFCVIYSLFLHCLLIGLIFFQKIEYFNILQSGETLNPLSLLIGLFLTHIVNILVYYIITRLQNKLLKKHKELEIKKNELQESYNLLDADLNIAREFQNKLIPNISPYPFIHFVYHPMMHVGGDFFDFVSLKNPSEIGIFLSDVSGHGVPAAFITSMIKTTILQSGDKKENPSELLTYLNDVLYDQTGGYFITAFYGIYNTKTKNITFANAGHDWPILMYDGKIETIVGKRSVPIGIFPNNELKENEKLYENFSKQIPSSSKILFFTDGFTEVRNQTGEGKFWGDEEILSTLSKLVSLSGQNFIKSLFKALVKFRGSEYFEDDVCIILLES